MTGPTSRQLSIVNWMRTYQRDNGMPPTLREMCDAFGFTSTNSAAAHLHALERKGLVRHHAKRARGWIAVGTEKKQ